MIVVCDKLIKGDRDMLIIILAFAVIILDQVTKYLAVVNVSQGNITIISGFFDLTLAQNTGAAFSIMQNGKWFFLIFTPIIIGAILFYIIYKAKDSLLVSISLSLIIGGAVGNYIDRIRLGYVVDFLDFKVWPVFNVADSFVVIGTCLFAWYLFFISEKEKKKEETTGGTD